MVVVTSLLLAGLAVGAGGPSGSAHHHGLPIVRADSPTSSATVRPSVGGTAGVFFQNDSSLAASSFLSPHLACTPTASSSACDSSSASPSLLNLANGNVGVAYGVIENSTTSVCGLPANDSVGHVAFAISTTNGDTWATPTLLGDANATCPYNDELEPAFTTNTTGAVEGVYIAAASNLTDFGLNITYSTSGYPSYHPDYIIGYTNRTSDAIVFVNSSDNGSTFSSGRTLVTGGNLARPAIATFGRTVYVAYENISKGTRLLPGGTYHPISVRLIASTDGGLTWGTPIVLPGENASDAFTTMSPSVSVSARGELAVAYVTNRTCISNCSPVGAGSQFGDDVVVATSADNGSTWSLHTVFNATGEPSEPAVTGGWQSTVYNYEFYSSEAVPLTGLFQFAPPTSVAWNTTGSSLFVAWGGSYNNSALVTSDPFGAQSVYTAASPDGGTTWTSRRLAPAGGSGAYPGEYDPTDSYNLGLTVSHGTVYLAETVRNLTGYRGSGGLGCGFTAFEASAPNDFGTIEWLQNSSNGLTWSAPRNAADEPTTASAAFAGYDSSVLVRNGSPVIASSLPSTLYGGFGTYSGSTLITVSDIDSRSPIAVTFAEAGLPAGTVWPFNVSGNPYATNASALTISNVPSGFPLEVVTTPTIVVNGTLYQAVTGGGGHRFFTNATVWVNYTTIQPFSILSASTLAESAGGVGGGPRIFGDGSGAAFSLEDPAWGFWYVLAFTLNQLPSGAPYVSSLGCPMPWYLPTGYVLHVRSVPSYAYTFGTSDLTYTVGLPVTYWSGNGTGSYTGYSANFTVTMNGPINETLWTLPLGAYTVTVSAPTLPTTSNFTFDWDGTPYAGSGGAGVGVPQVATGAHMVNDVAASSDRSGWVWVGRPSEGDPVIVPATQSVNLTFSFVDVAAPVGTIHFWAANLTNGTVWQFQFNGTWYSSSTPWINLTAHPGLYPVSARPATSGDASTGYAPAGVGGTWNVTTGRTYVVNYTPAFRVAIAHTPGGIASPTGTFWEVPGNRTTLQANASLGFRWLGWAGTGLGSYSGLVRSPTIYANASISETAMFGPDPSGFNLTFTEVGLPTDLSWQVSVGGQAYAATSGTLVVQGLDSCLVSGPSAEYAIAVPYVYGNDPMNATRYLPGAYPATECPGASAPANLTFTTQYYLTLHATGNGTAVSSGPGTSGTSGWFDRGATITLMAYPSSGAEFTGWIGTGPGSYSGTDATVTVSPLGAITEVATFGPSHSTTAPTYQITFRLTSPVSPGTVWTVVVDGGSYAGTGSEVIVTNLTSGPHVIREPAVLAPDGLTRYIALNASTDLTLTGNVTELVTYAPSDWLQVTVIGPGSVFPASEWVGVGSTVALVAQPAGSATGQVSWVGTGNGSYSGGALRANLTISAPVTELVDFASVGPAATASASANFWGSAPGLLLLGILGLLGGLALAFGLSRMRRRGPGDGASTPSTESGDPRTDDDDHPLDPPARTTRSLSPIRFDGRGRRPSGRATVLLLVALMALGGTIPLVGTMLGTPTTLAPLGHVARRSFAGPAAASAIAAGRGDFWSTGPLPPVANNSTCDLYACGTISDTNEPSLNLTSNGVLAAAYTAYTNASPCAARYPALRDVTQVSIGFTTSTDAGQTWSEPQYLGNDQCSSLRNATRYADAWQPTLTSLANGTLVLAFVEFAPSPYAYDNFPQLYLAQGDYGSSRLAVTESFDNGTTWTPTTILQTARISGGSATAIEQRPTLSAHGRTVYLAWTNVTADWGSDGAGNATGDSGVQFTLQQNGSAWHAPRELPVTVSTNRTAWAAANPYLLVLPNGTVVVSYATDLAFNQSFPAAFGKTSLGCPSYCPLYAGGALVWEIVAGVSYDNGTTFHVSVAASHVDDGEDYASNLMLDLAGEQVLPAPQLAYDPVHGQVVMTYAGDVAFTACDWMDGCASYAATAVFAANASVAGWGWESRVVPSLAALGNATAGGVEDSYAFLPTLTSTSDGTVYLSAGLENASACAPVTPAAGAVMNTNYFPMVSPGPVYCSEAMQVVTSSGDDGVTFGPVANLSANGTWLTDMPEGTRASMVSAGAQVWVAWTQSTCANWNTTGNGQCGYDTGVLSLGLLTAPYLANTTVEVSHLFAGAGATVTFQETGLPASSNWSAELSDNARAGRAGQNLTVSGVPTGATVSWNASPVWISPYVRYVATPSRASPGTLTGNTTITWTYSLQYRVQIASTPAIPASPVNLTWIWTAWQNGNVECLAPPITFNGGCGGTTVNYNLAPAPGTLWVDAGSSVALAASAVGGAQFRCDVWWGCSTYQPYLNLTFQSWSGNGSGAYTGTSNQSTITVRGPINETANFVLNGDCVWFTSIPWNSSCAPGALLARFHEVGLPAGVPWGVSVWGEAPGVQGPFTARTTNATLDVSEPQLTSVIHYLADTVPSATPGDVWVPSASPPSPLLGPVNGSATLTYRLEPVDAQSFSAVLEATGLPNGTQWSYQLDGAGGGALGGTANVTVGGGPHTIGAEPVYLANGSGYVVQSVHIDPAVVNGSWWNATGGSTSFTFNGSAVVEIAYTPVERLTVQASSGGTVDATSAWEPQSARVNLTATPQTGYSFVGWTGTGWSSMTTSVASIQVAMEAPVSEFATFQPTAAARYVLTVDAVGVPAGSRIAVDFNGSEYQGTAPAFALPASLPGPYEVSAPIVYANSSALARYLPTGFSTTMVPGAGGAYDLGPAAAWINITYAVQFQAQSSVSGPGSVSPAPGTFWETVGNVTTWTATPSAGGAFLGWFGSGPGSVNSSAFVIAPRTAGPIAEVAMFASAPQADVGFVVTVIEHGLPTGVAWSVSAGNVSTGSATDTAIVAGLSGDYAVNVPTVATAVGERFVSNLTNATLRVGSNRTVDVAFSTEFLVTVWASAGGGTGPAPEWVASGASILLNAAADPGFAFVNWSGAGAGNYTGPSPTRNVTVDGPITEYADFASTRPEAASAGGAPSYVPALVLLLLAGTGAGIGFLAIRRPPRREPPNASDTGSEPAEGGLSDGPAPAADT